MSARFSSTQRDGYGSGEPAATQCIDGREMPSRISAKSRISTPSSASEVACGRHRSRRDAADLGVMGSRGHKEIGTDLACCSSQNTGVTGGDVGKVRPTAERIVAQVTVPWDICGIDAA